MIYIFCVSSTLTVPKPFIPTLTSVVSEGEAQIPSSLGGQREQEVMSVLRFIPIHGAQSLNDLRGQSSQSENPAETLHWVDGFVNLCQVTSC